MSLTTNFRFILCYTYNISMSKAFLYSPIVVLVLLVVAAAILMIGPAQSDSLVMDELKIEEIFQVRLGAIFLTLLLIVFVYIFAKDLVGRW